MQVSEITVSDWRDLVRQYWKLAFHVLKRTAPRSFEDDDARSVATMHLVLAARAWKPDREATFMTYAFRTIRNGVRKWVGTNCRRISLVQVGLPSDRFGFDSLTEAMPKRPSNDDSDREADRLMACLTPREREVALLVASGNTYRETAEIIGITEDGVRKSYDRSLILMRSMANGVRPVRRNLVKVN